MTLNDSLLVHGFTVIRLRLGGGNDSENATHYLYLKEHAVKKHHQSKPEKRTLFVCNVPPYLSSDAVKNLFENANCGSVQKVFLHLKPEVGTPDLSEIERFSSFFPNLEDLTVSTRYAYVVFRQPSGVKAALSLPHDKPLVMTEQTLKQSSCVTGVEKWCQEYRQSTAEIDLSALEKEIESYVVNYDKRKKDEETKEKMDAEEDDEGWVKVGRKRGARFTESEQQHQHRREKKRKDEQELVHFYRFQLRESRREKIAELRKRFEEDKQRITLLRERRKFRPF